MSRWGVTLLKVAVSAVLLYVLFSRVDASSFWEMVSGVHPGALVAGALIFFLSQCVSTLRWSVVLSKDARVPYPKLFSMYFIGMFFNNFLPTIVGGDVVKGYYLYKETGRGDVSVASVFMDRYAGLSALITITTVALIIGYGSLGAIGGGSLIAVFMIFIAAFLAVSAFIWIDALHGWLVRFLRGVHLMKLNKKIDTFYEVFMGYKGHKGLLFRAFLLSLFIQGSVIAGYIVLGRGLGMDVSPGYFFLFVPLATAVSMVPLSLSGLGIREGAFVYLFTKAGASGEEALGLSLLWFAVMVSVSLIGGIEYVRRGGGKGLKATGAPGAMDPDA